jgi:hypothetical protein
MRKIGDFVHYASLPGSGADIKKRLSAVGTRFRGAFKDAITLCFRGENRGI